MKKEAVPREQEAGTAKEASKSTVYLLVSSLCSFWASLEADAHFASQGQACSRD